MADDIVPWPAIPEPFPTIPSLHTSVAALKEAVELLTGQRGPVEIYSTTQRFFELEKENENARASILRVEEVSVAGDQALAQSLTQLQTTVGQNTASINTVVNSVNGISVRFGVFGHINGVTGGFVLDGVQKLDGTATFNLEISANVVINGDLLVNGTVGASKIIDNSLVTNKIAPNAVSQMGANNGPGGAGVGLNLRAGAKVAIVATLDPPTFVSTGTASGGIVSASMSLQINGAQVKTTPYSWSTVTVGGNTFWYVQGTTLQHVFDVPSTGTYTFAALAPDFPSANMNIFCIELAR